MTYRGTMSRPPSMVVLNTNADTPPPLRSKEGLFWILSNLGREQRSIEFALSVLYQALIFLTTMAMAITASSSFYWFFFSSFTKMAFVALVSLVMISGVSVVSGISVLLKDSGKELPHKIFLITASMNILFALILTLSILVTKKPTSLNIMLFFNCSAGAFREVLIGIYTIYRAICYLNPEREINRRTLFKFSIWYSILCFIRLTINVAWQMVNQKRDDVWMVAMIFGGMAVIFGIIGLKWNRIGCCLLFAALFFVSQTVQITLYLVTKGDNTIWHLMQAWSVIFTLWTAFVAVKQGLEYAYELHAKSQLEADKETEYEDRGNVKVNRGDGWIHYGPNYPMNESFCGSLSDVLELEED